LVFIEGGTFAMGRVEQDVMRDWNNIPRRVTVSSFYMDEVEVTNLDYREYLYWLSHVYASDYRFLYTQALPDTAGWRSRLAYNEPFVELYLRHPAYEDYPVVNVSWTQASKYCEWRTDRVNEYILMREGIIDKYLAPQDQAKHFNVDAYLFYAGDNSTINAYRGEYMSSYSWASVTESFLFWKAQRKAKNLG
jgi:gliding motility-associated lipoprotein GldJ